MLWTKEEQTYLVENYPTLGANHCSQILGRSIASIAKKASALKLKIETKSWSIEKETFLKDNYNVLGPTKCAEKLDMSKGAVQAKAVRMNLSTTLGKVKQHEDYLTDLEIKNIKYIPIEKYITSHTKILHKCTEGHIWSALPTQILSGKGCPSCSKNGFDNDKPSILYYLKIMKNNLTYYKIGITNRTVAKRFESESKNTSIKVIQEIHYDKGLDARLEEKRLLEKYKSYRQHIPELLVSGGNTELFEFDVLGLDK